MDYMLYHYFAQNYLIINLPEFSHFFVGHEVMKVKSTGRITGTHWSSGVKKTCKELAVSENLCCGTDVGSTS